MMSIIGDCPQCRTPVKDKDKGCDLMVSFITCRNESPEKEKRSRHLSLMRREIEMAGHILTYM